MTRSIRRRTMLAGTAVGIGTLGTISGVFGKSEYTIQNLRVAQNTGPLSLDVELVDPDVVVESHGVIRLTVTNTTSDPLELYNIGVVPFGVLRAKHVDRSTAFRLDSPLYDNSEYIDESGGSFRVSLDELSRTLDPEESMSAAYSVHGDRIPHEGPYEIEGRRALLVYSRPGQDDRTEATPTVQFDIGSRGVFKV